MPKKHKVSIDSSYSNASSRVANLYIYPIVVVGYRLVYRAISKYFVILFMAHAIQGVTSERQHKVFSYLPCEIIVYSLCLEYKHLQTVSRKAIRDTGCNVTVQIYDSFPMHPTIVLLRGKIKQSFNRPLPPTPTLHTPIYCHTSHILS